MTRSLKSMVAPRFINLETMELRCVRQTWPVTLHLSFALLHCGRWDFGGMGLMIIYIAGANAFTFVISKPPHKKEI